MVVGTGIGTWREGSLHASLKTLYARSDGEVEALVDGCVVDVARGDELVEIQTGSFASARRKLERLVRSHRVLVVYPIAVERWIVRVDADGALLGRRRSPKRGGAFDVFDQLVSFPALVCDPNFRLEIVFTREDEVRGPVPDGVHYRYRRDWVRLDRRLIEVVGSHVVEVPGDLLELLPASLPDPFTTSDIVAATGRPGRLAMRAAYCLQKAGLARPLGRQGRRIAYTLQPAAAGEAQPASSSGRNP